MLPKNHATPPPPPLPDKKFPCGGSKIGDKDFYEVDNQIMLCIQRSFILYNLQQFKHAVIFFGNFHAQKSFVDTYVAVELSCPSNLRGLDKKS